MHIRIHTHAFYTYTCIIYTLYVYIPFQSDIFLSKNSGKISYLSQTKSTIGQLTMYPEMYSFDFRKMGVDLPLVVAVSANASKNTAPVGAILKTPNKSLTQRLRCEKECVKLGTPFWTEMIQSWIRWLAVVWVTIMNSFQSGILSIHIQEFTWKSDQKLSHRWQDIASIFVGLQKLRSIRETACPVVDWDQ